MIDRDRARLISNATLHLPDDLAAEADKVLAEAAPELRLAGLQRKAARLEARLDPEGVARRKDEARHDRRVELRREGSGAASLAGRELDPAEAMVGKASIDAEAVRLRNAGLPGTLAQIRAAILMDRIHQRSPWDRLALPPTEPQPEPDGEPGPGGPHGDESGSAGPDPDLCDDDYDFGEGDTPVDPADESEDEAEAEAEEEDEGRPAGFDGPPPGSPFDQTGRKTPMPALINITIPAGTLLGWSGARRRRDLGPDGRRHRPRPHRGGLPPPPHPMVLHLNRARRPGHRPRLRTRTPPLDTAPAQPRRPPAGAARRAPGRAERRPRADRPRGTCDHAHREDRYTPSRKLKHLIRARTARCGAPGCGAQAITSEIDHTIPVRHEVAHIERVRRLEGWSMRIGGVAPG